MYAEVIKSLRQAYDSAVELRERSGVEGWKVAERDRYLELLRTLRRSK